MRPVSYNPFKTGNLALFYGRPMVLRPNFTVGLPFSEIRKFVVITVMSCFLILLLVVSTAVPANPGQASNTSKG